MSQQQSSSPTEGDRGRSEKPEDKLGKKANDSLQSAADKPGVEHLNDQLIQDKNNQKTERNQTLAEQIEKTGQAKIGTITQNHGQSIEITDGDKVLVKGRSKDEVAAALKEMQEASEKGLMIASGGKFTATDVQPSTAPDDISTANYQEITKQVLGEHPQDKPVLIAYGNDTTSDIAPKPGQIGKDDAVPSDARRKPFDESPQEKPYAVTVQDFGGWQQWGADRAGDAERLAWPHRGLEDNYIDFTECKQAYKAAQLDKYPGVSSELIGAAMRNEQQFYKNSDADQDKQVLEKGTVLKPDGKEDSTASIGPAQIQIRKIRELVNAVDEKTHEPKYPFLSHMKGDPIREALKPKNAALLTAAYFEQSAEHLKSMSIPVNDRTLAYTWNPDVFKASGKYECPSPVQLKAERSLPTQIRPHRESIWNPTSDEILNTSTHVKNVEEQVKYIRSHHLMPKD